MDEALAAEAVRKTNKAAAGKVAAAVRVLDLSMMGIDILPVLVPRRGEKDGEGEQGKEVDDDDSQLAASVEVINLHGNALTASMIDAGIGGWLEWCGGVAVLVELFLSANLLESVPDVVCSIETLETLSLAHNAIAELPDRLARLARLRSLDVSHNKLDAVPARIAALPVLNELRCDGNTGLAAALPPGLVDDTSTEGQTALIAYLRGDHEPAATVTVVVATENNSPAQHRCWAYARCSCKVAAAWK
ncbi:uncharacterized protein AMSG_05531 [Thecamonas trahens ATCC 50062]|uniref:Uncharacterized protein n=1 Tax=Thecamonas trahens ATCC 50062 TaxID=461836 RepID=A0A0L0DDW9_THETB|nr:hypothetical protein AMSG_05531 [Thecamonas trahens ATCC 50062]KNC49513.1 hypothetical protein AMSG_05531 [Thecamonas trahens ATCC 50062]|eukprot:XP_013757630.1 hypothetical protein AMSG_05531 [Thecamonas trahens ATCC 50062]